MAKLQRQVGTTSQILEVFVQNSSLTTGAGLTGLVFNTASLTAYYKRNTAASSTSITLATATLGTWATGGFKEVDATNMPGVYEFDPPNAALASGADSVVFYLQGATNMAPCVLEVELTATTNQTDARVTQNLALSNFEFLLVSSTDHVTPVIGASVTATRSIDGGAFAACANSAASLASGIYTINLAATDLNGKVITFLFQATGADNRYVTIVTQA